MGAPTKAQSESWSDSLAAIIQKHIDAFKTEYTTKTVNPLYDLIDASGDPDVEGALVSLANKCDLQSFPELSYNWLKRILACPEMQAFVTGFRNLVLSSAGGGYSTFRAYIVDKAIKFHPLYGELHSSLYSSDFALSGVIKGFGNPNYGCVFANRIYRGADGSLAEETTDASSATTADVTLVPTNGHSIYIGCDRKFSAVCFALSTLGSSTITPTFKYWNGNSWATLTVTDNTAGLTASDIITFTPPADWTRCNTDLGGTGFAAKERLYYIRINRTNATGVTPAVGTCITLVPTYIPFTAGSTTHASLPQPPLAICRITAASTMTVTIPASIDFSRFAEPLGTENCLTLRALTAIGSDLTVTLAYTNSTPASASAAQSAWTAPAALGTATIALTGSDALRAVLASSTVSTAATTGVFAVECAPIRTPAV